MKGGNVIGRLVYGVQNITKPLMNNPEPVIGGEQNPINPNPVKGHFISNEQSNNHNTLLAEQEIITKPQIAIKRDCFIFIFLNFFC